MNIKGFGAGTVCLQIGIVAWIGTQEKVENNLFHRCPY